MKKYPPRGGCFYAVMKTLQEDAHPSREGGRGLFDEDFQDLFHDGVMNFSSIELTQEISNSFIDDDLKIFSERD